MADRAVDQEELVLEKDATLDSTAPRSSKKFRVQLDFEASDMDVINNLVDQLELGTRAELFRSSLRALRWMVEKKMQNYLVVAMTPDDRLIEPEFDFLDALNARKKASVTREQERDLAAHA
jgi:hypothetical protein